MHQTSLTVRHRLKQATEPAHVSLETRIGPLTTQSVYNEYVRGLYAFRASVEEWLSAHGLSGGATWTPQSIAPELQNDLHDLKLTAPSVLSVSWAGASPSFALGVHYVLEGSSLGARVLCKQVAALGMHRDYGARHLWAQADSPLNWRGFLDVLSAHNGDEDELIAGANAAFNAAAVSMERTAYA